MAENELVFGIAGNKKKPLAVKTARQAITFLERKKISFFSDSGFLKGKNSFPLEKIKADFFLVFGGDGTLLHVVREISSQKPLLGINCGTHGHLMAIKPEQTEQAIEKILNDQFSVEQRSRLAVFSDGKHLPCALNEVIVSPKTSFTLSNFSLRVDSNISDCSADAIAVVSPTGSTGFAIAAGGKEIKPAETVFEILPVHSFSGPKAPFIVPDISRVSILPIEKEIPFEVIIDCQCRFSVKKNVIIEKSSEPALFVKLS